MLNCLHFIPVSSIHITVLVPIDFSNAFTAVHYNLLVAFLSRINIFASALQYSQLALVLSNLTGVRQIQIFFNTVFNSIIILNIYQFDHLYSNFSLPPLPR